MMFKIEWQWFITLAVITTQFVSNAEISTSPTDVSHRVNDTSLAEEITKITKEFDELMSFLSPSIITLNRGLKLVEVCIVSEPELDLISEIIKDFKNEEFQIIGSSQCSPIDEIKKAIFKLKYDFKQVIKNPVSMVKYEMLKARCETQLQLLNKHMGDVTKRVTAEEMETFLQLLKTLQAQVERINNILKDLETKVKSLDNA